MKYIQLSIIWLTINGIINRIIIIIIIIIIIKYSHNAEKR